MESNLNFRIKERLQKIRDGELTLVDLPFQLTNRLTNSLLPGTITLICGTPGASKSFMLLQCFKTWFDNGEKVCIYELEETAEYHLMRLLAQQAGIPTLTDVTWVKQNIDLVQSVIEQYESLINEMENNIVASPYGMPTLTSVMEWVEKQAKAGFRVICIDPITIATSVSFKSWEEEATFMHQMGRISSQYECSVVLVTHPKQEIKPIPDMSLLAGSAAFSRFSQTIFWLEYHDSKESDVKSACGTMQKSHNRTLHILKSRNGKGQGLKIAFDFTNNLMMVEKGIIIKKEKQ